MGRAVLRAAAWTLGERKNMGQGFSARDARTRPHRDSGGMRRSGRVCRRFCGHGGVSSALRRTTALRRCSSMRLRTRTSSSSRARRRTSPLRRRPAGRQVHGAVLVRQALQRHLRQGFLGRAARSSPPSKASRRSGRYMRSQLEPTSAPDLATALAQTGADLAQGIRLDRRGRQGRGHGHRHRLQPSRTSAATASTATPPATTVCSTTTSPAAA